MLIKLNEYFPPLTEKLEVSLSAWKIRMVYYYIKYLT